MSRKKGLSLLIWRIHERRARGVLECMPRALQKKRSRTRIDPRGALAQESCMMSTPRTQEIGRIAAISSSVKDVLAGAVSACTWGRRTHLELEACWPRSCWCDGRQGTRCYCSAKSFSRARVLMSASLVARWGLTNIE